MTAFSIQYLCSNLSWPAEYFGLLLDLFESSLLSAFPVPGKSTRKSQRGAQVPYIWSLSQLGTQTQALPLPELLVSSVSSATRWLCADPSTGPQLLLQVKLSRVNSFSWDTKVNSMEYNDSRKPKPHILVTQKAKEHFWRVSDVLHPNQSFRQNPSSSRDAFQDIMNMKSLVKVWEYKDSLDHNHQDFSISPPCVLILKQENQSLQLFF